MLAAFCLPEPAKTERRACFELRQVPKPTLERLPPGSVIIRTVATSICGSDFWGKGGCCSWRRPIDYLETQQSSCGGSGHEVIGEVVEVAEPCSKLYVGQRVLAMSASYIHKVTSVRATFEQETGMKSSLLPKQGSFAEYFVTHACACLPVPKSAPFEGFDPRWFVVAQPLGTLIHACKKLDGSVMGRDVAIVGQGQNGLIMTQMIANMGAKRVIGLDLLEERLEYSKRCRATHTIQSSTCIETIKEQVNVITDGKMCDIVVDMVGHQEKTVDLCAQLTKDGGTVLLFGLPPAQNEDGFSIHFRDFIRNIRYVCSHSPGMDCFELAIEFLQQGRIDPEPLITHYIPFERFPEAYVMASEYKDGVVKIILTFERQREAN